MRLKLLLRYPVDIRRARRLLQERVDAMGQYDGRPLVLDLRTPQLMFDCGRHFQSIAYHAHRAGSSTTLRCSNLLLGGIARKIFGREMLSQPYVQRVPLTEPLPAGSLVLGDYEPAASDLAEMSSHGIDYLRMRIGRQVDRSMPVMPYPMHPATLRHLEQTNLRSLRDQDTDRRAILFAGSQKSRYGDAWMQREFGILSRLELLDTLRQRFPDRIFDSLCPESQRPESQRPESQRPESQRPESQRPDSLGSSNASRPIVLIDSREAAISADHWLPTLASARFFLCCPGGRQPLCHNLIEAMSVGTIPLIEYGDRITPPLRDGETAICFDGRRGLIDAVERIDRMTSEELVDLSRRVATFYDEHLCGTRFFHRLRDGHHDLSAHSLCMPFHERDFYESQPARAA